MSIFTTPTRTPEIEYPDSDERQRAETECERTLAAEERANRFAAKLR
jgi:hypothetical protein